MFTIAGGREHIVNGYYATVGGGFSNKVNGYMELVAGGRENEARGKDIKYYIPHGATL